MEEENLLALLQPRRQTAGKLRRIRIVRCVANAVHKHHKRCDSRGIWVQRVHPFFEGVGDGNVVGIIGRFVEALRSVHLQAIHSQFQQGEKAFLFVRILCDFLGCVVLARNHHFGKLEGCIDRVERIQFSIVET